MQYKPMTRDYKGAVALQIYMLAEVKQRQDSPGQRYIRKLSVL